MPPDLNPVVLITGSTGNVGLATARAFLQAGARLVLLDRATDRLPRLFPELDSSPHHLLLSGVNLADEASVGTAIQTAITRFGRIDTLVNTVGAWRGGSTTHAGPLADWAFLHEANVLPVLITCRAIAPQFINQGSGAIINVSARSALHGDAGNAAYSASKAAVLRLTESLSAELRDSGVNVNAVLPSTIDTPQNRAAMPAADHVRWVTPEAIADVILFLASHAGRAIHGASIPVYGRA